VQFLRNSYTQHARHFAKDLVDEERIKISNTWFDESTADYWRHARAYECVECLNRHTDATWLTVGDGRWGLDSIRIRKKGFASVLPSDISAALLEASKQAGHINEYSVQNAERLTFEDQQFDYVFCKESFHHFPRPYLALYEMLRVAKRAVFLIEPNDTYSLKSLDSAFWPALKSTIKLSFGSLGLRDRFKALLRRSLGSQRVTFNSPSWEDSGNYVYALSRREAEKIALGLNLPQLAFKGLNDHYVKGCEFEPADLGRSAVFRELVNTIQEKDRLCQEGLADHNMIMIAFFMDPMDVFDKEIFASHGWDIVDLPRNPHTQEEK
jgi:SAM-dependent methyltransferase